MNGRELAKDLAKHLHDGRPGGRMVWEEVGVGPMWGYWDAGRVDVLTMEKSYSRPAVRIYEVKVSRGDFWADVSASKYEKYLKHCSQFYFAAPSGLLKRDEIPAGCGLIVKGDSSWAVVKGAKGRQHDLTVQFLIGLLMHGFTRWTEGWKQREREDLLHFKDFKTLAQDFGIEVANEIATGQELLAEAEKVREQLEQFTGRKCKGLWEAAWKLKHEVDMLQSRHRFARASLELFDITRRLIEGSSLWAHGTPEKLRAIAEEIEKQEEAAKERELSATGAAR